MVNDQLAGKEMAIGRYYQRAGQPLAAINRYKSVIDNQEYQRTSHTPEALYRLVEVNLHAGSEGRGQPQRFGARLQLSGQPLVFAEAYALLTEERSDDRKVAPTGQARKLAEAPDHPGLRSILTIRVYVAT